MSDTTRIRYRLAGDVNTTVAKAGLSMAHWAELAGVSYSTIKALRNPNLHPNRKGGMHETTAWKLARAYAKAAHVDEDEAFRRLIVAEEI